MKTNPEHQTKKKLSIPVVFCVTGHTDIRSKDIPRLKQVLRSIFSEYQTAYKNTQFVLFSALAEGADQIAAETAVEAGISLHIVLPYEKDAYLDSFSRTSAVETFKKLESDAQNLTILGSKREQDTDACYQLLGEYLVNASNIFIAFYDGKNIRKQGGTSDVVRFARKGETARDSFQEQKNRALYIINTPRQTNPDIEQPFAVNVEYPQASNKERFVQVLSQIDTLNTGLPEASLQSNNYLEDGMTLFDEEARKYQKQFQIWLLLILTVSWVAVFSLEVMHNLRLDYFIIGYGVGLFLAYCIFWLFMKNGKIQNNFIQFRGIAEALRVQKEWNRAGLDCCVADHFLSFGHEKFNWLKTVLKNIYHLSPKDEKSLSSIHAWIDSQIQYFDKNIPVKEKKLNRLLFIGKLLFSLGFLALIVMFSLFFLETAHIIGHHSLPLSWHHFVLLSGVLIMTGTFIVEKYIKIQGYEEDLYNYKLMRAIYLRAKENLVLAKNDEAACGRIVFDLGKKALEENSKWVLLHERRRAEPKLD